MADNREYFTQTVENGSIQIAEDVVASVAAMAALEVDGVCGLNAGFGSDIAEMLGKKNITKGIRISGGKDTPLVIECNIVARIGTSVFDLAKAVQAAVKTSVESTTGLVVEQVNVNIGGISLQREAKK
ncbi:MAG: Asp23/Gls24 family envelope stress response protein [Oscillospiraceae bacterium]|nr:Asp23/Gls24 family envelope stress response protein [Oscillospiraceae bacterium]